MFDYKNGAIDFAGDLILPAIMDEKPLAMAYVRNQTELEPMDVENAFDEGTLFKNLCKPFTAGEKRYE